MTMSRMLQALQQIEARSPQPPPAMRVPEPKHPAEDDRPAGESPTNIFDSLEKLVETAQGPVEKKPSPKPRKPAASPYGHLADAIVAQFPPGDPAAILFTNADGTPSQAEMIAGTVAALAERVTGEILAVDCDLAEPWLAEHFSVPGDGAADLAAVLRGSASWEDAVRPTRIPRVSLLPGGRLAHGHRAAASSHLASLVEAWRADYQFVVLHASSVGQPEIPLLAAACDGVYLVLQLGHTGKHAALRASDYLQTSGRFIGCVLAH